MSHKCYNVIKLPDIQMYGGDCTPWVYELVNENGSAFTIGEAVECRVILTVVPFDTIAGPVGYINTLEPVIRRSATLSSTPSGGAVATFEFSETDTKELCGKFIYQIEVAHGQRKRIGQGDLHIFYNVDQGGVSE